MGVQQILEDIQTEIKSSNFTSFQKASKITGQIVKDAVNLMIRQNLDVSQDFFQKISQMH